MQKDNNFLTIDQIRELFKKQLNVKIQRPAVYHYIKNFGFPESTGWGRPRSWDAKKVHEWFSKQKV